jgi:hypothetical protein
MHSSSERAEQPEDETQPPSRPWRASREPGGNAAWKATDTELRWSHQKLRLYATARRLRWARDGGSPNDWR